MFIRLSKLTDKPTDNNFYINTDQIITYGPNYGPNRCNKNETLIRLVDDGEVLVEKPPKEVTDILRDCGVEVWR